MEDDVTLKGPNKVGLFHRHEEIADGKGNFKDGWRDGLWEIYWDDGMLSATGYYREGKKQGHWKTYYKTGGLSSEGNYSDDKKDGIWKNYWSENSPTSLLAIVNFNDGKSYRSS